MKKITSLVTAALVICSFSACANRNTAMRNQNGVTNQGTTRGTRTGYNMGTTQSTYKDGTYTGQGNNGANGIQTATVVISGGRITDITLNTANANNTNNAANNTNLGRTMNNVKNDINNTTDNVGNTVGLGNNTTTGRAINNAGRNIGNTTKNTARNIGNSLGIGNNPNTSTGDGTIGARNYGTPGTTTGGVTGDVPGGTTGNTGYLPGNTGTNPGTTTGIGNTTGNTTGRTVGRRNNAGITNTATNVGSAEYENIRRDLAARMLKKQSYDVTTAGYYDTSLAENWRLAVGRALEKARS